MFVTDLRKGDVFTTYDSMTPYTFQRVRTQDGYAYVTATLPNGTVTGFGTRPFSSVTLLTRASDSDKVSA